MIGPPRSPPLSSPGCAWRNDAVLMDRFAYRRTSSGHCRRRQPPWHYPFGVDCEGLWVGEALRPCRGLFVGDG